MTNSSLGGITQELLAEVADHTPWASDYEWGDFCHFCGGHSRYGKKPWRGHSADCLWVLINQTLGRDVSALIEEESTS